MFARAIFYGTSRNDTTYLRMVSNMVENDFGFEFGDGVTLAIIFEEIVNASKDANNNLGREILETFNKHAPKIIEGFDHFVDNILDEDELEDEEVGELRMADDEIRQPGTIFRNNLLSQW